MPPFIHHEKHVADVNTYATRQAMVEVDVATEAIPVAIEG